MRESRSQLLMRRPRLDKLPAMVDLPHGYSIRGADDEDKPALAELLTRAFPEEPWDIARVESKLLDCPEVFETFVVEKNGRVVATASERFIPNEFPGSGYLHWVAVHPDNQGIGLGRIVSLKALHSMRERGRRDAVLETDDQRLPAIRTYLNLGFLPEDINPNDLDRWNTIFDRLDRYQARKK